MKKTELQEIADLLANSYDSSGRHFEITDAEKYNDGTWRIGVREIKETEKNEVAENESNK